MKKPIAKLFDSLSRKTAFSGLLFACLLAGSANVKAIEDPPNCNVLNGGLGNTSTGGAGFDRTQTHVGDTVPVHASLGMAANACRATNATGTIYIATGPLTNFLVNVTLNPGTLNACPGGGVCRPGPYNLLITPALVGAGVSTPNGAVPGVAKTVRIVENAFGTVLTGEPPEALADFHSASIGIVTPCIRVVRTCDLAPGQNCFPVNSPVQFRGYVTNCGDITLTNVVVVDNRAGPMALFNPTDGSLLTGNVTLAPGAYAVFTNSFLPTAAETSAGSATDVLTATARDTTAIGGPNAFVTNSAAGSCAICDAGFFEDPAGCSLAHGGQGPTAQGSVGFDRTQAHVGDTVNVHASLGMVSNACKATHVTGTIYITSGPLTNFLANVTLVPGDLRNCPNGASCQPGPYRLLITPNLVGAGVGSPNGSVSGAPKTVQVVENGVGSIFTGDPPDQLADFHSGAIQIVTPCIQVVKLCDLAPGQDCFPAQTPVRFRGYVTNCGDITLTNVVVADNRAGAVQLYNPVSGVALTGNVMLAPGGYAVFTNSFVPTSQENSNGRAASVTSATARDITVAASPNAFVTNSNVGICAVCGGNPEEPSGCSIANGGLGSTSQGGVGFDRVQAYIGDTVSVHASLGMAPGACRTMNATGTIYIATGPLTNFLVNVTLHPGDPYSCPADAGCKPGPYNLTITPALVGAAVTSPNGSLSGVPNFVHVVQNGNGRVLTGNPAQQLLDFHTASLPIVTPCIQVAKFCDLSPGQTCFPAGTAVQFRGYVTNCGNVALTNVTVVDDRGGLMLLYNPTNGSFLSDTDLLPPGRYAVFTNSFFPTAEETSAGRATNTLTATARDITTSQSPKAYVTNSIAGTCAICDAITFEDPPACSVANGGGGRATQGSVGFDRTQAHLGDTVSVHASLGMVGNSCRATHVVGTIYVATGPLTDFLADVTLIPGDTYICPNDGRCRPGPYRLLITPDLVGAEVASPNGSVGGIPQGVRVVENGFGTVWTGSSPDQLADFHAGTIEIVSPCVQVVKVCDLPLGQECFAAATPVRFRGYVTNCGDITLTNLVVVDNRAGAVQLYNPTNGSPLTGNVILAPGASAVFTNSFLPTLQENLTGQATNVTTATARDVTAIATPNAFVTNSNVGICAVCGGYPEDPPNCSLANGGLGNTSQGGVAADRGQAHVGDTVSVFASLGMAPNACRAVNATGTIYIATGPLTSFLVNMTLNPGDLLFCPQDASCQPGPYEFTITPALVGAGVSTPNGSVPGAAKVVRVVQNGSGTVLTGNPPESLTDFHFASIAIVTPGLRVFAKSDLPPGQSGFPSGTPVQFRGYVTNSGDVTLTFVTVMDDRTGPLVLYNPTDGSVILDLKLAPGAYATFTNSFLPTPEETSAGGATVMITASARDTTPADSPNAFVTDSTTAVCAICGVVPCLSPPTFAANGQFQFTVTGEPGANYVIQVSTNLGTTNWLALLTNASPFTFVQTNALLYPLRFYRAMFLPAPCGVVPCLSQPAYAANGQFQFTVTGLTGSNYVVQVSTNLATSNWLSLRTNASPFTFVDSNAALYPRRFYRAMFLP